MRKTHKNRIGVLACILSLVICFSLAMTATVLAEDVASVATKEELMNAVNDQSVSVIKLTDDIEIDDSEYTDCAIKINKSLVLDLNGHTLSHSADAENKDYFMISVEKNGNLTVKDTSAEKNGVIQFTAKPHAGYTHQNVTVYNCGGTIRLESGCIKNDSPSGGLSYAVVNSSNAWGSAINSYFYMDGGRISAPNGDAAVRLYMNNGDSVGAKNYAEINGGVIVDTGIFVDTFNYNVVNPNATGELNINGGEIHGLLDFKMRHVNFVVNIKDGVFADTKLWARKGDKPDAAFDTIETPFINISGGKWSFNGTAFGLKYNSMSPSDWGNGANPYSVSGGVFNKEVPAASIIENKECIANANNETKELYPYTIGNSKVFVAQIGDKKYETLAEAIDIAESGQTITLLVDLENIGSVNLPAGVTLDGDDHKISGNSSVHINAAGGTVKNVNFVDIHNSENKLSAIYANNLTGIATISGCLFDNCDWDAIQVTPKEGSTVDIENNTFEHTNTETKQLRYVHIESSVTKSPYPSIEINVTDNKFYNTKAVGKDAINNIGAYYINYSNASAVNYSGNWFETIENREIKNNTSDYGYYVYPSRSQADVDVDDIQPAARRVESPFVYYNTLQEAFESGNNIILMKNTDEDVTVPEKYNKQFQTDKYRINSTITNNGSLYVIAANSDEAHTGTIINNGSLKSGNFSNLNGLQIINNGKFEITGSTKVGDLSTITNNDGGIIEISGGTFSTKPNDDWILWGYHAVDNGNGTFTVEKRVFVNDEEALAAGAIAKYTKSSATEYINTLANGGTSSLHFLKDITEDVVRTSSSSTYFYADNFKYTGSLDATGKTVYVKSGKAEFNSLKSLAFNVGATNTQGVEVTVHDGKVTGKITVYSPAILNIDGGTFTNTSATAAFAVNNGATLTITGGTFKSDQFKNYIANGYEAVDNGDETWTVKKKAKELYSITTVSAVNTVGNEAGIANLSGGGLYKKGDTAYLAAPVLDNYKFKGWYIAGSSSEPIISNEAIVNVTEDAKYVALYEPELSSTVTITAEAGDGGNVNEQSKTVNVGETVTFTASADESNVFVYWTNEYGKVISKDAQLTLTATKNITVKAVFGTNTSKTIVYQDESGNVLGAHTYTDPTTANSTVIAPSKKGSEFTGWTATHTIVAGGKTYHAGDSISDSDLVEIIKFSDNNQIAVKANYKEVGYYTIRVYAVIDSEQVEAPIVEVTKPVGTATTITVDSQTTISNGEPYPLQKIVAPNNDEIKSASFTVNPEKGTYDYFAHYAPGDGLSNTMATLNLDAPFATDMQDGNVHKVSLSMSWNLPNDAELIDAGICASPNSSNVESMSSLYHTSIVDRKGSYTLHINVTGHEASIIYARAFVKYSINGEEKTAYSGKIGTMSFDAIDGSSFTDILCTSYNGIKGIN